MATHIAVDHEVKYLAASNEHVRLNGVQDPGNWPAYPLRHIAAVGTWSKSEYGEGNGWLACEVPTCNDENSRYFFQTSRFIHSSVRFTSQTLLDIDGYKLEFFQDMETW